MILYSDLTDSRAELHEVWLLEELAERIRPGTVGHLSDSETIPTRYGTAVEDLILRSSELYM